MEFTSKDYFKINGVSSDTVGIWVDTPSVPPMAHRRYKNYLTSVDEDYTYDDLQYSLTFYTFRNEDFDNTDIYAFLADAETLEFSRLNGFYYKIKDYALEPPELEYDGSKVRYTLSFILEPFRYKTDNPEIILSKGEAVENTGTRYSKPTFTVTGSGDVSLKVNDVSFDIADLNGTITIDSETMQAYTDGGNALFKTTGNFSYLHTGTNVFDWSGNVTSVILKQNERCY